MSSRAMGPSAPRCPTHAPPLCAPPQPFVPPPQRSPPPALNAICNVGTPFPSSLLPRATPTPEDIGSLEPPPPSNSRRPSQPNSWPRVSPWWGEGCQEGGRGGLGGEAEGCSWAASLPPSGEGTKGPETAQSSAPLTCRAPRQHGGHWGWTGTSPIVPWFPPHNSMQCWGMQERETALGSVLCAGWAVQGMGLHRWVSPMSPLWVLCHRVPVGSARTQTPGSVLESDS